MGWLSRLFKGESSRPPTPNQIAPSSPSTHQQSGPIPGKTAGERKAYLILLWSTNPWQEAEKEQIVSGIRAELSCPTELLKTVQVPGPFPTGPDAFVVSTALLACQEAGIKLTIGEDSRDTISFRGGEHRPGVSLGLITVISTSAEAPAMQGRERPTQSHSADVIAQRAKSAFELMLLKQIIPIEWKGDLLAAIVSEDVVTRRSAASALKAVSGVDVIDALKRALTDADADVRCAAAISVWRREGERARSSLDEMLNIESSDFVRKNVKAVMSGAGAR